MKKRRLDEPIKIRKYLVEVKAVAQRNVNALNADEARGYVKGMLRVRNPDFQFVNTIAKEIGVLKKEV